MNKPVIVSEEALVAPVVVADAAPGLAARAAVAGPAYVALTGISFSHFLNDTMQSLIASVYPILKDASLGSLAVSSLIRRVAKRVITLTSQPRRGKVRVCQP